VVVFFIRNDKFIGREYFLLDGTYGEEPGQILTSFVKQYYTSATSIPPLILLQYPVEEPETLSKWLMGLRGAAVTLIVPQRGVKKQLIQTVAENARQGLLMYQAKQSTTVQTALVLEELKERLGLPSLPIRIEGYDVSNIRGKSAVGGMVVFERGFAKPAHYRRFKLVMDGIDDYAMIREMLTRRFKRYLVDGAMWSVTPDLVLIDGGRGHLNAALEVMKELEIEHIPVVSLAKENEDLFVPDNPAPIEIPRTSAALHLLQRVRDEAHRFALGYHRKVRQRDAMTSLLDAIPGIGPKRKKALLRRFGSLERIRAASVEELVSTKGMTRKLAAKIKEYL
jgi:excinuclease ABC subunit C